MKKPLFLVLLGVAGIVFYVARPREENSSEEVVPTLATTPAASAPPVVTTQRHVPQEIQRELERVDPRTDGWDAETVNEMASASLKSFGDELVALTSAQKGTRAKSVFQDVTCTALKPLPLREVYRDGMLSISKWNPASSAPIATRSIAQAAAELFGGFDQITLVKPAFKIVRVELDGASAETKVKVQLSFHTPSRRVQQNAIWNCAWRGSVSDGLHLRHIQVEEFEEVVSQLDGAPLFADCTEAVVGDNKSWDQQLSHGIDHWRDNLDWRLGLDVAGPHGLAVGDVNGDGRDDLFVCEPGGLPNRLYVQTVDGKARDASAEFGVDWLEPATSALFVDADNDGDQDLLFTSGRFFVVCENVENARFSLRHVVTMSGIARSIAAADFDNDRLLDVYVCCYINRAVALADVGLGMPMPYHDANNGPANVLFKNVGALTFQDVTSTVGLQENNQRFSYAASWEDYDQDGDVDLYVANDFGRNNLYQNEGDRFRDVAKEAGVEDIATGMSVSWGDYDRDGQMDLYVGNMFSTAGNRIMYQRRFQSDTDEVTRNVFRRLARGNSLFRNNGDGTFTDVSLDAGAEFGRWAWASMFLDMNNDGWEDILIANGMITSEQDTGDL